MAEYIEREALRAKLESELNRWCDSAETYREDKSGVTAVREALYNVIHATAADVVSRAAFDQVVWERDVAMKQLEDCGIPFGGKADVAPVVRGKWIAVEDPFMNTVYDCSACKETFCFIEGDPRENLYSYCPNCGADMRVDEEEKTRKSLERGR